MIDIFSLAIEVKKSNLMSRFNDLMMSTMTA